jgi:hypothetical protein
MKTLLLGTLTATACVVAIFRIARGLRRRTPESFLALHMRKFNHRPRLK